MNKLKIPLQFRIFIPMALLIALSHYVISYHVSRVLETDKIFESIIVSILQRNIVGSAIIVLMIAYGLASYIAHGIQSEIDSQKFDFDLLKDLNLDTSNIDSEFDLDLSNSEDKAAGDQELSPEITAMPQVLNDRIARELVHPLAAILGHAQIAKMKNPDEELLKNIEFIEEEARKVKKQIEEFAKGEAHQFSQVQQLHELFAREERRESLPRVRRQTPVKLGKAILENFAKIPMPPEPHEIPSFSAFPEVTEEVKSIAGFEPQLKLGWQEVSHKQRLTIRRPVTRVQNNET